MTINRKTLTLLVILGGWADIILTLIGQIGQSGIREDAPISRAILLFSPWALLIIGFAFHAFMGLIVLKSDKWIAIPLALIMLISHFTAIFFWILIFGIPIEAMSTAIYFVPLILIVIYIIRKLRTYLVRIPQR
jgi:hypothetical protein